MPLRKATAIRPTRLTRPPAWPLDDYRQRLGERLARDKLELLGQLAVLHFYRQRGRRRLAVWNGLRQRFRLVHLQLHQNRKRRQRPLVRQRRRLRRQQRNVGLLGHLRQLLADRRRRHGQRHVQRRLRQRDLLDRLRLHRQHAGGRWLDANGRRQHVGLVLLRLFLQRRRRRHRAHRREWLPDKLESFGGARQRRRIGQLQRPVLVQPHRRHVFGIAHLQRQHHPGGLLQVPDELHERRGRPRQQQRQSRTMESSTRFLRAGGWPRRRPPRSAAAARAPRPTAAPARPTRTIGGTTLRPAHGRLPATAARSM